MTTVPTLGQSSALARLVHWGELTDEHRYLIAKLLDEIGTSVRVAADAARKYVDDPAARDAAARVSWEPVGAEYVRLLDVVAPPE
ncbi:MAG: hypothetical protein ACRDTG_30845 [Pseudonocardiaceae bacterium]